MVSPYLVAVGAEWEDGLSAGGWIADRLGPFGPSVGHAVPLGYPDNAIVPIPWEEDHDEVLAPVIALDALLEVLDPFTGDQPVHSGIWPGFGWMYETGDDPRTAPGIGAGVYWPLDAPRPAQEEIDRALAEARDEMVAERVQCPDAEPLILPNREYYLWSGPLRSAMAFRHQAYSPPSLIWPEDRSWFIGAPIYTNEIAVAGPTDVVEAVLRDPHLNARSATPDDELDIDD
ncbi:MAG: hypothetical protein QOJ03_576 [Frankiaceae bacterium]|nr:hypothetical protein [Frankiaceae bacterium]